MTKNSSKSEYHSGLGGQVTILKESQLSFSQIKNSVAEKDTVHELYNELL